MASLVPLCAAMALGFLTVSMPLPALPLHVRSLGFGTELAGLAVGVQSFATILTRPSAGRLTDARGPKIALTYGLLISSSAGVLYLLSLAAADGRLSLMILLLGRLVLGAGESLLITGVLTWALVRAGEGRAGRAMAWNGVAQYGALAFGAPVGFWLYEAFGFVSVAICTTALPLMALAVIAPLAAATPSRGIRMPLLDVLAHIWGPGLGLMLAGVGFAAISTFASLDFVEHDWPGAGNVILAYGVCFVGTRMVASGVVDRTGGAQVAALSSAVEAVGQFLLWRAPGPHLALVGAALTGCGCSLVFPSLGVEAFRRVPEEQRGIAVGVFAAFQDFAIGATGPVLGSVAAGSGTSAVFSVGTLAAVTGCLAATWLAVRPACVGRRPQRARNKSWSRDKDTPPC